MSLSVLADKNEFLLEIQSQFWGILCVFYVFVCALIKCRQDMGQIALSDPILSHLSDSDSDK